MKREKQRWTTGCVITAFMLVATYAAGAADSKKRVLCFGDSITATGTWVASVGSDPAIETINAGKSGRKAAEAKKPLAVYLKAYPGFLSTNMETVRPSAEPNPPPAGWPEEVREIEVEASVDNTIQPMLTYTAKSQEKRPLLVGLHTWSGDYRQAGGQVVYARWCIERDWHFVHPHFRGPNWTPEACGSEKVVQDIVDAVEYMTQHATVDTSRIYLAGASGGGYAALLMAGRTPEIWAGVSAWVPISDIRAWWEQCDEGPYSKYARHIEKAVGGRPDQNEKAAQECVKRSPVSYLSRAASVNLDINAGVTDGHKGGSVPFSHALYAFNSVVPAVDRLADDWIESFYARQGLPEGAAKADADPLYGDKDVIFRKISGNTRVSIFMGGHEIIHQAALNWLAAQRKGAPAVWNIEEICLIKTGKGESDSGK